jgi:hypothetical protein
MERRKSSRIPSRTPVVVRVLGNAPASHQAYVAEMSERGMRLCIPEPLLVDQCLQVEFEEAIVFAEVFHCGPAGPECEYPYAAGVVIRECLSGLASLQHLIQALRPAEERTQAAAEPSKTA